jgi:hypothetical protein
MRSLGLGRRLRVPGLLLLLRVVAALLRLGLGLVLVLAPGRSRAVALRSLPVRAGRVGELVHHLFQRTGLLLGAQESGEHLAHLAEPPQGLGVLAGELRQPLRGVLVDGRGAPFGVRQSALGLIAGVEDELVGLLIGRGQDPLGLLLGRRQDVVGVLLCLGDGALGLAMGLVDDPFGLFLGLLANLGDLLVGVAELRLRLFLGQVDDLAQPLAEVVAGGPAALANLRHLPPGPLDLVERAGQPCLELPDLVARTGDVFVDLAAVVAAHDDLERLLAEEIWQDLGFVAHWPKGLKVGLG